MIWNWKTESLFLLICKSKYSTNFTYQLEKFFHRVSFFEVFIFYSLLVSQRSWLDLMEIKIFSNSTSCSIWLFHFLEQFDCFILKLIRFAQNSCFIISWSSFANQKYRLNLDWCTCCNFSLDAFTVQYSFWSLGLRGYLVRGICLDFHTRSRPCVRLYFDFTVFAPFIVSLAFNFCSFYMRFQQALSVLQILRQHRRSSLFRWSPFFMFFLKLRKNIWSYDSWFSISVLCKFWNRKLHYLGCVVLKKGKIIMYYIISLLDLLLAILATLFESTKLILLVLLLVFYYLCLIL